MNSILVRRGSLKVVLVLLSLVLSMAATMFPYGQSYAQSAQPDELSATDHFNRGDAKLEEGLFEEVIADPGESSNAAWKGMRRRL